MVARKTSMRKWSTLRQRRWCLPWRRCGRAPSTSPTRRSLLSITGRYAIALYPYLNRLTDATADPQQIISMIIALHSTTPDIADLTPIDDLRIRNRPTKCAASMPAEPLGASSQRHRVLPALLGSTPASRRRTPRRSCSAEKAADGSDREPRIMAFTLLSVLRMRSWPPSTPGGAGR
jgi:hypothetical protein